MSKLSTSLMMTALLVIAASIGYGFVIQPILADAPYRKCMSEAESLRQIKIKAWNKAFAEGRIGSDEKALKEVLAESEYREDNERCFKTFRK